MADEEKSSMGDGEKPSMGDGEMSMADGEHSKDSVVLHFCRIEMIKHQVNGFTEAQRTLVNELGAGFVFNLGSNAELIPSLTKFCVHNVDCEKGALKIKEGVFLPIKDGIKDLYNMSDTGEKLKHHGRAKYKPPDTEEMSKFEHLSNISIPDLWIEVTLASGADFCTLFMLALLNTVLAPSRNTKVDTSFLIDLMDHEKIKKLDWCSFIATFLINSIRAYQIFPTKAVPGCLHVLHLMCARHYREKAPLTHLPVIKQITDADLKHAAKLVSRASLKNGKSADSVHSESMDSSPHNFRSKNARKAVTQKTSARVRKTEIFLDSTDEILGTLKDCCDFETDVPRPVQSSRSHVSLGTAEEHSSPVHHAQSLDEDLSVMSSGANDEDRQVTSSAVRVEEEPQLPKRRRGRPRTRQASDVAQAGKVLASTSTQVEPPAQRAKRRGKNQPHADPIFSGPRIRRAPTLFGDPVLAGQPGYSPYATSAQMKKTKARTKKALN